MGAVALYMRLSNEDANEGESFSIGNQRDLLHAYLREHPEMEQGTVLEFLDDGYSGTNFDRPGIQELLSLAGKTVDCIIVKDFSRFGRNLIEVGDYLDRIFPFLGVRFIAVNEGYDSEQQKGRTAGFDVTLKALIHEMYCRDISEKIRCVQQAKMKKGEYMCAIAFYGYKKSETVRNRLEIDEAAAEIVRRVFREAAAGVMPSEIATRLNGDGILSPLMYRKSNKEDSLRGWKLRGGVAYWTRMNVRHMLLDERYTGCMISRKRTKPDVTSKTTITLPKEEWIVVENTHEGIVSKELFAQAQKVLRHSVQEHPNRKPFQKFRGILRCKYCGMTLTRTQCKAPYYYCLTAKTMPDMECKEVKIEERRLDQKVLRAMRTHMAVADSLRETNLPDGKGRKDALADMQKEIRKCNLEISRCKAEQTVLFEDYAEGRIDKKQYIAQKGELAQVLKENTEKLELLTEQVETRQKTESVSDGRKNYAGAEELTREMLEELVTEIKVGKAGAVKIIWKG